MLVENSSCYPTNNHFASEYVSTLDKLHILAKFWWSLVAYKK